MCCCVGLSLNKKSIFGLRMWSQLLYLLLIPSIFMSAHAADTEISCTIVRNLFEKKDMLPIVDIQEQPNSDADELCLSRGCCGAGARAPLTVRARADLEDSLRKELGKLAEVLSNRAKRFDDFFRKLLALSREEFHAMFKRTYGMIYEQHSYVFEQFFEQLERYYTRGDTDFDQMIDMFFGILYQKMFIVVNSQYTFDDKYLKCVQDNMHDIQPFEDVPDKLSVQLRRAFVATRTFHKALRAGSDVVRNMMQVGVTSECVTSWARLRYCGACAGHQALACSRYCHNVIRGCLPAHADLGEQWDAYVDAVEKVADRLLGPFNIAMVVEPIDIKISEAIMSFQEHSREISQKIFSGCGKPALGGGGATGPFFAKPERTERHVRSIPDFDWGQKANDVDDFEIEASFESLINEDPSFVNFRTPEGIMKVTQEMAEQAKSRERFLDYMKGNIDLEEYEEHERAKREAEAEPAAAGGAEIDFKSYEFDGKRSSKKKKPAAKTDVGQAEWGGPALERLVRETRARVRGARRYWTHLPALLCSTASVTTAQCFNGTEVAPYTLSAAGEGSAALASNPEVRGASPAAGTARAQLDTLRALTAKLKDAFNGVEVHWRDDEDQQAAGSSVDFESGSGSGSGDGTDDTEDLPDDSDTDDMPDYGDGSGDSKMETVETEDGRIDMEDRPETPAPVSEPPFIPNIISGAGTNNVNLRDNSDVSATSEDDPPVPSSSDKAAVQDAPVKHQPVPGSADRPSLHKALLTYALPVVCAWFGAIVTDLF